MASKNKSILSKNHNAQKHYRYSKGNSNLSFSLDLAIKSEVKDFLDLLHEAVEEVTADVPK